MIKDNKNTALTKITINSRQMNSQMAKGILQRIQKEDWTEVQKYIKSQTTDDKWSKLLTIPISSLVVSAALELVICIATVCYVRGGCWPLEGDHISQYWVPLRVAVMSVPLYFGWFREYAFLKLPLSLTKEDFLAALPEKTVAEIQLEKERAEHLITLESELKEGIAPFCLKYFGCKNEELCARVGAHAYTHPDTLLEVITAGTFLNQEFKKYIKESSGALKV